MLPDKYFLLPPLVLYKSLSLSQDLYFSANLSFPPAAGENQSTTNSKPKVKIEKLRNFHSRSWRIMCPHAPAVGTTISLRDLPLFAFVQWLAITFWPWLADWLLNSLESADMKILDLSIFSTLATRKGTSSTWSGSLFVLQGLSITCQRMGTNTCQALKSWANNKLNISKPELKVEHGPLRLKSFGIQKIGNTAKMLVACSFCLGLSLFTSHTFGGNWASTKSCLYYRRKSSDIIIEYYRRKSSVWIVKWCVAAWHQNCFFHPLP